jgi:hypothetical protein
MGGAWPTLGEGGRQKAQSGDALAPPPVGPAGTSAHLPLEPGANTAHAHHSATQTTTLVRAHMRARAHTRTRTHARTHTHTHTHTPTHTRTQTRARARAHARTHARTQIRTRTERQTRTPEDVCPQGGGVVGLGVSIRDHPLRLKHEGPRAKALPDLGHRGGGQPRRGRGGRGRTMSLDAAALSHIIVGSRPQAWRSDRAPAGCHRRSRAHASRPRTASKAPPGP